MIAWSIARAQALRMAREAPVAARVAAVLLVAVALVALLAPLGGYVPGADVDPSRASLGPGASAWLGTDHLGRDRFWRLLLATRSLVLPGAVAAAVAVAVGVPLGAASGWSGGAVGAAVRALTGSLAALPRYVWVLLVCAAWGDAPVTLAAAVGLAWVPQLAEAVHGRLRELHAHEVLLASRAHGVPEWRLLWVHGVLAGCGRLVARHALSCFGGFAVVESSLAYLGDFGVREPWPSFGNLIAFEWGWSAGALVPAVALWVVVAAVVVLADALKEPERG